MIFKKLINKYRNLSIQLKLTICVIVAAAIPAATMGLSFSSKLYDMVISDTIRSQQSEAAAMAPYISDALTSIEAIGGTLSDDPYYQSLFYSTVASRYSSIARSDQAAAFKEKIDNIIATTPLTAVKIYVDLPSGQVDFFQVNNSKDLFLPESASKGTYWHGIFSSSHPYSIHCPSLYLSPYEISNYGDCAYIYRTSTTSFGVSYTTYVALYYSSQLFSDIMADSITVKDSVSYIINERNAIIASTNEKLSGMYYQYYNDLQDNLMSSNSFVEKEIAGKNVYLAIHYLPTAKWFIVTVTPQAPLITMAQRTGLTFVLIFIVAILVAITIAMIQTRSITSRLSTLTQQMSKVRTTYPVALPEPAIHDEVGQLISTYNYMTQEMDTLVEKQKQTAEELKMSEFNALAAQINPHFLYNMMDVINWMVLSDKPAEASKTLQQLARFYKLTLSQKKNIGKIKTELEHANVYIDLQNMRFGGKFDLVIDMPDELCNCQIPKLTLQPIIENAILHGIMEKEEKYGTIVITGWEEDHDICILVSDDGAGIAPGVLPQILSSDRPHAGSGTNVAVYNIHNRLQLLYGPDYGLSYESSLGQGCDVTIRIPKMPAP